MGIDIYARWKNQTPKQEASQVTGWSVMHGRVGYLREAYHGGPYATQHLCKEAFDSDEGRAEIQAKVLRKRLPKALKLVEQRERNVYKRKDRKYTERVKKSFRDFVELCARKEKQTGQPFTIIASY